MLLRFRAGLKLGLGVDVLDVKEMDEEDEIGEIHGKTSILNYWIEVAIDYVVDHHEASNDLDVG